MKRYYFCKARTSLLKSVLVLFVMMAAVAAKAQDATTTYNFRSLPAIDSLLFAGDATNWTLVTEGTSKTTFSPDAKVTRAQTVTFLWRMADEPAVKVRNPPPRSVGRWRSLCH